MTFRRCRDETPCKVRKPSPTFGRTMRILMQAQGKPKRVNRVVVLKSNYGAVGCKIPQPNLHPSQCMDELVSPLADRPDDTSHNNCIEQRSLVVERTVPQYHDGQHVGQLCT